jgi:hypothetical protein
MATEVNVKDMIAGLDAQTPNITRTKPGAFRADPVGKHQGVLSGIRVGTYADKDTHKPIVYVVLNFEIMSTKGRAEAYKGRQVGKFYGLANPDSIGELMGFAEAIGVNETALVSLKALTTELEDVKAYATKFGSRPAIEFEISTKKGGDPSKTNFKFTRRLEDKSEIGAWDDPAHESLPATVAPAAAQAAEAPAEELPWPTADEAQNLLTPDELVKLYQDFGAVQVELTVEARRAGAVVVCALINGQTPTWNDEATAALAAAFSVTRRGRTAEQAQVLIIAALQKNVPIS